MLPARPARGRGRATICGFAAHREVVTAEFSYEVLARKHGGRLVVEDGRVSVVAGEATDVEPLQLGAVTLSDVSWLEDAAGKVWEISLRLSHAPARIFGLGERYNALDQAGNRVDQFVYNQYKEQGEDPVATPCRWSTPVLGFEDLWTTDSYSWFDFREPGMTLLGVEAGRCRSAYWRGASTSRCRSSWRRPASRRTCRAGRWGRG